MSRVPQSALWVIRDARCLSEHAKCAYVMLWTRQPDIRPSMKTLGLDMGASHATAKRAVAELEAHGLLKRIGRVKAKGDNDSNIYQLSAPPPGWGHTDPTSGHTDPTPRVTVTRKDSNVKLESEGSKRQGSRRAHPAAARELSDPQKIEVVRQAVAEVYGTDDATEMSDGQAWQLWDHLVEGRRPSKPLAYFTKIFEETPYLDTHLANCDPDWDPWAA